MFTLEDAERCIGYIGKDEDCQNGDRQETVGATFSMRVRNDRWVEDVRMLGSEDNAAKKYAPVIYDALLQQFGLTDEVIIGIVEAYNSCGSRSAAEFRMKLQDLWYDHKAEQEG